MLLPFVLLLIVLMPRASAVVLAYHNSAPPPDVVQLDGTAVTSVVVSGVHTPSRSVTIDVGSLWHDPLVSNPRPAQLDVNVSDSMFSRIVFTSAGLPATSHATDACDFIIIAQRPAPHWKLRSLRVYVQGTATFVWIDTLLLCNASLTLASSLRVVSSVLSNTRIRVVGIDTRSLQVLLDAPLTLQRGSALAVDSAANLMWRLSSDTAAGTVRLLTGSSMSVRNSALASSAPLLSGVTVGGNINVVLEDASQLIIADNRCRGAAMCSAVLSLGGVTLRGGSLLSLSSNVFSVATMAQSAAALALYRAGIFVTWTSLRVVEASTFAVDGNDVTTDSHGLYVAGGTAATPVAVDLASGGVVSITANRVAFSRQEEHVAASLPANAAPIDFAFACHSVCLNASDATSVIRIGWNNFSISTTVRANVSLSHLHRMLISGSGSGGYAVRCSRRASVVVGGGGHLSLPRHALDSSSTLQLTLYEKLFLTGSVSVESDAVLRLQGSRVLALAPTAVVVPVVVGGVASVCALVAIDGSISVVDRGLLVAGGHSCVLSSSVPALVEIEAAALVAAVVTKELQILTGGCFAVEGISVSASQCSASRCVGVQVAVGTSSSSSLFAVNAGTLSVSHNSIVLLESAAAGVLLELPASVSVVDGGSLFVNHNTASGLTCALNTAAEATTTSTVQGSATLMGLHCAGVSFSAAASTTNFALRHAIIVVSFNTIQLISTAGGSQRHCTAAIAFALRGLRVHAGSSLRVASNVVSVVATAAAAAHIRGVWLPAVLLCDTSHVIVVSNNVTVSAASALSSAAVELLHDGQVLNGSTAGVLHNTILVTSTHLDGTVTGVGWQGKGVANASHASIYGNLISVAGIRGAVRGVHITGEPSQPFELTSSKLTVENNEIVVSGSSSFGVHLQCTSSAAPGALFVTTQSWLLVSGNNVASSSSASTSSARQCGIAVEATSVNGIALVVRNGSLVALEENSVRSAVEGILLAVVSVFDSALAHRVNDSFGLLESQWLEYTGFVVSTSSVVSLSKNTIFPSTRNGIIISVGVVFNPSSHAGSASVPKCMLLAENAVLLLQANHVESHFTGIVVECGVNSQALSNSLVVLPAVASVYAFRRSLLKFSENTIRSVAAPIRWLFNAAGHKESTYLACDLDGSTTGCTGSLRAHCVVKDTLYLTLVLWFDGSTLALIGNVVTASGDVSAMGWYLKNGNAHTAKFSNSARFEFIGNAMMTDVVGYRSSVDFFMCREAVSGVGSCISRAYWRRCELSRDYRVYSPLLAATQTAFDFSFNATLALQFNWIGSSRSAGLGFQNGLQLLVSRLSLTASSTVVVEANVFSGATAICVDVVGGIVLDAATAPKAFLLRGNTCGASLFARLTLPVTAANAGSVVCQCNILRGRKILSFQQCQSAMHVNYDVFFDECTMFSFTGSRSRSYSLSKLSSDLTVTRQMDSLTSTTSITVSLTATRPTASASTALTVTQAKSSRTPTRSHRGLTASHSLKTSSSLRVTLSENISSASCSAASSTPKASSTISSSWVATASSSVVHGTVSATSSRTVASASPTASCLIPTSLADLPPAFADTLVANGDLSEFISGAFLTEHFFATVLSNLKFSSASAAAMGVFFWREIMAVGLGVSLNVSIALEQATGQNVLAEADVLGKMVLKCAGAADTSVLAACHGELIQELKIPFSLGDGFVFLSSTGDLAHYNHCHCGSEKAERFLLARVFVRSWCFVARLKLHSLALSLQIC